MVWISLRGEAAAANRQVFNLEEKSAQGSRVGR